MLETITMEVVGRLTLPIAAQARYGFTPDVAVRVIETPSGLLLVPLTNEPMSQALKTELAEWQALGEESLANFPFTLANKHRPILKAS